MQFLKNLIANVLGTLIAIVLAFILMFIMIASVASSIEGAEMVNVKEINFEDQLKKANHRS